MAERELTRQREAEARTKGHYETLLEEWALFYKPFLECTGNQMEQMDESPDWKHV